MDIHTTPETLADSFCRLRRTLATAPAASWKGVVGFDGFVDTFIRLLKPDSMAEFGPKVAAAAGIAASYAVDHQGDKFGGNGPLFAAALADLSGGEADLAYVGGIGGGEVEPIFAEALSGKVGRMIPLAPSAHSDCLEFTDGKIMLGDFAACDEVTLERLIEALGEDGVDGMLEGVDFVSAVNWGKLPNVGGIWSYLADRLRATGREPKAVRMFMDLAEFEHRPEADVEELIDRLPAITGQCLTLMSFNLKEAWQMADRFGGNFHGKKDPDSVTSLTRLLRDHLAVDKVIVHPNHGAACASADCCVYVPGPYCERPLISTGAGDNFGAGCLAASLLGCDDVGLLLMGNSTSGHFVRSGRTPDLAAMDAFLGAWMDGTLAERL